jgi:hypothetical protein
MTTQGSMSGGDRPIWTGRLTLELRNGRDGAAGDLELDVRLDTIRMWHVDQELTVVDRDYLRSWLMTAEPEPYRVENTVWSAELDRTYVTSGHAEFWVTPESLNLLVQVI